MGVEDTTTRRAIEICMSRLPMHGNVRDWLAQNLTAQIKSPTDAPLADAEKLRADIEAILSTASGIDTSFPKAAMLARFSIIREIARGSRHD